MSHEPPRSFAEYMHDWNDACVYARECLPDFGFMTPPEPYSALAVIAGLCYYIWRRNEKRIQNDRAHRTEDSSAG